MAKHAKSAVRPEDDAILAEGGDVGKPEPEDTGSGKSEKLVRQRFSRIGAVIAAGVVIVASLAGVAGWLGYHANQDREAQSQRTVFLQVARQAAINLTTISYTEVDADIQRILDSATGAFRDDIHRRAQSLVEVVRREQSRSEGTVSEAGFLTDTRDRAQVLLAVSVKTSTAAATDQDPRRWRMRIDVQNTTGGAKVSNVEFVP